MKNSKQVETILKVLEIKKHAQLQELTRIMHLIEQRHANLQKMLNYQADYHDPNRYALSQTLPPMNRNMHLFLQKMAAIIAKSVEEIERLQHSKQLFSTTLQRFDHKIELFNAILQKLDLEKVTLLDTRTQHEIDDLMGRDCHD